MGFGQAVSTCLRNYVGFTGRARRSEFWWWVLFLVLLGFVAGALDSLLFGGSPAADTSGSVSVTSPAQTPIRSVVQLLVLLPNLAVTARRLHDTGRSGWWQLVGIIPIIGWIVLIIWLVRDSEPGANRFGPSPKDPAGVFAGGMPQPGTTSGYGPQDRPGGPIRPY